LRALDCSATFGGLSGGAATYIYDTFSGASGDTSFPSPSMTRRCDSALRRRSLGTVAGPVLPSYLL